MELGSKLNAVDIREGDDVYFECTIDAFPQAERILWKKDVSELYYQSVVLLPIHYPHNTSTIKHKVASIVEYLGV